MDFARRGEEVVARAQEYVWLLLIGGVETPVDAKLARDEVGLLSAGMTVTLGTRTLAHAHEERHAAVGVHPQHADLHAGRARHEGTRWLARAGCDGKAVHAGKMTRSLL